ncbi:MAG: amino acid adenylation domain-containing protein [Aquabacterium sp.]
MDKHSLAVRFALLPPEKKQRFLEILAAQDVQFGRLPIVPRARDIAQDDDGAARCGMSFAQQRQWFLWQLDPQGSAYHIAGALRLKGALNADAVQAAFDDLVARHESLRTRFKPDEQGHVQQVILPAAQADFNLIDLGKSDLDQALSQARTLAERPFDLTRDALLRVAVIRLSAHDHVLAVVMHHIVSDGWSMQVIVDEFVSAYQARLQDRAPQWPALPIQYADYAAWQRDWLACGEKERQLAYWREQLGTEQPVLQLATDHPRQATANYRAASHSFALPQSLVEALKQRAQAQPQGGTLFMVLLAGLQALLHRYSGQGDIRVGVPIANRHRVETEGVVGFFVNTQVLRNRIDARQPLQAVLDQACQAALGAQAHQDLPFEQLVEALQPERSLSHSPLFQVMYNHQRQDKRALTQLAELGGASGLTLAPCDLGGQAAQFELTLDTAEQPDGQVLATLTYAQELFEPQRIERMAGHYLQLLKQLATAPQQAVGHVDLLTQAEHAQLQQWGRNAQRYPVTQLVHQLVESQAQQRPDATALIFGDQQWSYAQFNQRANQLAHHLIALGVGPDVKVGIAVERSIEMVVSLLAVLKAGGAYVPLDPDYPSERLAYMIEDSRIKLLLTQSHLAGKLPQQSSVAMLALDQLDLTGQPTGNPGRSVHPESLAYVIYTSGSTGKPKGVAIAQGPLAMHVQSIGQAYGMTPEDRELQFASINFDGAHERTWVPLAFGAALMPRDKDIWTVQRTCAEIARHRITIACFTPSYLHQLAELMGEGASRLPIRSYTVGGEAMSRASFDFVQQVLKPPRIVNGYGPTETVITPMIAKAYPDTRFDAAYMPIGSPVGERQCHILDTDLNPVPQGVAGELYIGDSGLARGYLNRSGLTAERFVADPFNTAGGRLYRTGDLACWRTDGQIDYLGRVDHQVKVRGFRIELGEIEAQLLAVPSVSEAVVVVQPTALGPQLVAYIAGQGEQAPDSTALRQHLTRTLPDYMVPAAIVAMHALPLNANGKVDRAALPMPEMASTQAYEAPESQAEMVLAAIWAEVLGIERVGRHDNFFELGGHSLAALQITGHLSQRHGAQLPVRLFFETPDLKALAAAMPAGALGGADSKAKRMDDMDLLLSEFEA